MEQIKLVALREIKARFQQKSFIITTLVFSLLIIGAGVVFRTLDDNKVFQEKNELTVGVTQSMSPLSPELTKIPNKTVTIVDVPAEANPQQVAKEGIDGSELDFVLAGDIAKPQVWTNGEIPDYIISELKTVVNAANTQAFLTKYNIDPTEITNTINGADIVVTDVSKNNDDAPSFINGKADPSAYGTATTMLLFLLMAIMTGANMLSMGVVEEKSSRVVEVILSIVTPGKLLAGKVLGLGLVSLVQFISYILSSVIGIAIAKHLSLFSSLTNVSVIIISVVWMVIGYFLFGILYAAFASLVSRQEEIGGVIAPLTFSALIPFYLAIYLVPFQPEAVYTRWISYFPLFAPFMMPIRAAFGASWLEQLLSLVIALVCVPLLIILAGRIYKNSILRTGSKVKILTALRGQ